MKARYNPLSAQEKRMAHDYIRAAAEEYIEKVKRYLIFRFLGIFCIELNERYGFGRKRLCQMVYQLGEQFAQLSTWGDAEDDILVRALQRLHMNELAETLEKEADMLREENEKCD